MQNKKLGTKRYRVFLNIEITLSKQGMKNNRNIINNNLPTSEISKMLLINRATHAGPDVELFQ